MPKINIVFTLHMASEYSDTEDGKKEAEGFCEELKYLLVSLSTPNNVSTSVDYTISVADDLPKE